MAETHDAPTLQPLSDAPEELGLRKESWKKGVYELVADDAAYARLDYALWSGKAKAEAAGQRWAFGGRSFWKGEIVITDAESDRELATFDNNTWTRGGTLELDGTSYELHVKGLMTETWRWERDGEEVLRFHDKTSFGKDKGTIELLDRADPNVALLALLSVHVNIGTDQASAGSMTAINASVIAST